MVQNNIYLFKPNCRPKNRRGVPFLCVDPSICFLKWTKIVDFFQFYIAAMSFHALFLAVTHLVRLNILLGNQFVSLFCPNAEVLFSNEVL